MKKFLILAVIVALIGAGILLYLPLRYYPIIGYSVKYSPISETIKYSTDIVAAANTKNISLCDEEITDLNERDACYSFFADVTGDSSVCEKITNPDRKNLCLAMSTDNPSFCEKILTREGRDECYFEIISRPKHIATLSLSLCEKISDSELRERCYLNLATVFEDVAICEKIQESQERKDKCYLYVSRLI